MRTDPAQFTGYSRLPFQEPVFVVELSFDEANTDIHYFTLGDNVSTPTPANTIQSVISKISGTSQKLDPANFNSTIGNINFSAVDVDGDITDLLRAKDQSAKSLRHKRVRIKKGFAGFAYADFVLVQTQIIDKVTFDGGTYNFKCYDVQRFAKKTIFDVKTTTLTADIAHSDSTTPITITVESTDGFEVIEHGSAYTDAPNVDAGYLYIEDDDNWTIYRYSGKTATAFTGCIATLNSRPYDYAAKEGEGVDEKSRDIEVKELVYLEMPAVKCAYALLTGNLYNQAGKRLPDHWCAGIDPEHISTTEFTGIGPDLWDINNDDIGSIVRFIGIESVQAKSFIQKEIYSLANVFSPILSNGEMGLRRLSPVISSSPYSITLDEDLITKASAVTYAMNEVRNKVRLDWAWDFKRDDYRRTNILFDQDGINKYGDHEERSVQFKGLQPKLGALDILNSHFSGYYDRFGDQPLRIKVDLLPSMTQLEVGDLVRVDLSHLPDFTDTGTLKRTFEVQSVKTDWVNGGNSLELFGSGRKSDVTSSGGYTPASGDAVDDAWYDINGTKLNNANYAQITDAGADATLTADLTLAGQDFLWDTGSGYRSECVYYVLGNFRIMPNVTLTINKNVILKIMGTITIDGDISGVGKGHLGGNNLRYFVSNDARNPGEWDDIANGAHLAPSRGIVGVPLNGQPAMAPVLIYTKYTVSGYAANNTDQRVLNTDIPRNINMHIDRAHTDPHYMTGTWPDLRGGGGYPGGAIHAYNGSPVKHGGNGGNGGAGLIILCRGMALDIGGNIDLSGNDSGIGVNGPEKLDGTVAEWAALMQYSDGVPTPELYAGAGAGGAPGCLYVFIDGSSHLMPTISGSTITQEYGRSIHIGSDIIESLSPFMTGPGFYDPVDQVGIELTQKQLGVDQPDVNKDGHKTFTAMNQLVPPHDSNDDDLKKREATPATFVLAETIGRGDAGKFSAIEVTVTPPSDTNYSYSQVRYIKSGQKGWTYAPPAEPESVFIVPSDGGYYWVQILAVSAGDVVSTTGPILDITVYDFDAAPETAHPPTVVTGLKISGELEAETIWNTKHLRVSCNVDNTSLVPFVFDDWISHLEFTFSSGASVIHIVEHLSPSAELTFEQNNLSGVRTSVVTVEVVQVTKDGRRSAVVSRDFTNTVPALPSNRVETPNSFGVDLSWDNSTDDDFRVTNVYLSEVSGFTPGVANLKLSLPEPTANISTLKADQLYYYVLESIDWLGNSSGYTSQRSFVTETTLDAGGIGDAIESADLTRYNGTSPPADGVLREIAFKCDASGLNKLAEFKLTTIDDIGSLYGALAFGSSLRYENVQDIDLHLITGNPLSSTTSGYRIQRDSSANYLRAYIVGNGNTDQTMVIYADLPAGKGVQGILHVHVTAPSAVTIWQTGLAVGSASGAEITPIFNRGVADGATRNLVFRQSSQPAGENAGDQWYETDDDNRLWYFNGSIWQDTRDTTIAEAAQAASGAQTTADGKIVTFFDNDPPGSGTIGDLWFELDNDNRLYRHNGTSWVPARDAGIAEAIQDASNAKTIADGKAVVWYDTNDPLLGVSDAGDLWYNSNTKDLQRWNGTSWSLVSTAGATWGDNIDGPNLPVDGATRNLVFRQSSQPVGESVGDLWFNTGDNNRQYYFNGSSWLDTRDATIAAALGVANGAQSTADGKIVTFFQSGTPSGTVGDLWFNTGNKNELKRHNGSAWVLARDTDISQAISDASGASTAAGTAQGRADDAYGLADGKIVTFYSTGTPGGAKTGDLWYNSSTKELKRFNGSSWYLVSTAGATSDEANHFNSIDAGAEINTKSGLVLYRQHSWPAVFNEKFCYIQGFYATGLPGNTNGYSMLLGVKKTIPWGRLKASVKNINGYIIAESGAGTPFPGSTAPDGKHAMCIYDYVFTNAWHYDSGGGAWVQFSPSSTMYIIGTIVTNNEASVSITHAELWSECLQANDAATKTDIFNMYAQHPVTSQNRLHAGNISAYIKNLAVGRLQVGEQEIVPTQILNANPGALSTNPNIGLVSTVYMGSSPSAAKGMVSVFFKINVNQVGGTYFTQLQPILTVKNSSNTVIAFEGLDIYPEVVAAPTGHMISMQVPFAIPSNGQITAECTLAQVAGVGVATLVSGTMTITGFMV